MLFQDGALVKATFSLPSFDENFDVKRQILIPN
jgi:hypothetical protein